MLVGYTPRMRTEDNLRIVQQGFTDAAVAALDAAGADDISGEHYTNATVHVRRVDGGIVCEMATEALSFRLERVGDQWEIFERTVDDQQVYHASPEDFLGFQQMIASIQFSPVTAAGSTSPDPTSPAS